MSGLDDLLRAAAELQTVFIAEHWKFCFIGGVAVQRWGNPRFTQDIDLTLLTGFGGERAVIEKLLTFLLPRRSDATDFAMRARVLLAQTRSAIPVDIALGALPFEERSVTRASDWTIASGIVLHTCSAEDLVIHKIFAGRPRDWDDVESVLIRQKLSLNWNLIESEAKPLLELKEDFDALGRLKGLIEKIRRRLNL
jgi:hypothetical protein